MAPAVRSFDRFAIIRELGRGSTAVVYEATYLPRDRRVALRVPILQPDAERAAKLQRFLRECQVLAGLTSPPRTGIPALHMVDEHQGQPFSVREFVVGSTLEHRISERSVSLATVLGIIAAVARIVDYVHSRGFVHRNLSAANMLVAADGGPWLIGFGKVGRLAGADPFAVGHGVAREIDIRGLQNLLAWSGAALGQPLPSSLSELVRAGSVPTAEALAEALAGYLNSAEAEPGAAADRPRGS